MTNEINQALSKLPVRTLRALLQEVYEVRQQAGTGNLDKLPLITLHLKSGKEFSGWLLALGNPEDEKAKNSVMLHRHDLAARNQGDSDVLYLDLEQIEAITVHKAHRAAVRLAEEWKEAPPDAPKPAPVDAKRKATELAQFVSKIGGFEISYEANWDDLPKTDGATFWLVEAIVEATGVISIMLNSATIKEIFANSIKVVRFVNMPQPTVKRDGAALVIGVNLAAGRTGLIPQATLRGAIEDSVQAS